jgi:hypothetical protein
VPHLGIRGGIFPFAHVIDSAWNGFANEKAAFLISDNGYFLGIYPERFHSDR